jgi:Flp pilus assembly protein TadB
MPDGKVARDLHLNEETIIIPESGIPDHAGIVVPTRANLDGAYEPAQLAFAHAVQAYAERLAIESANQEISERAPGVNSKEITESAVIRAKDALDKKVALQQRKRSRLDPYALAGSPIFASATGVMGSYLHSLLQVVVFTILAMLAIACILHLSVRRMR